MTKGYTIIPNVHKSVGITIGDYEKSLVATNNGHESIVQAGPALLLSSLQSKSFNGSLPRCQVYGAHVIQRSSEVSSVPFIAPLRNNGYNSACLLPISHPILSQFFSFNLFPRQDKHGDSRVSCSYWIGHNACYRWVFCSCIMRGVSS